MGDELGKKIDLYIPRVLRGFICSPRPLLEQHAEENPEIALTSSRKESLLR